MGNFFAYVAAIGAMSVFAYVISLPSVWYRNGAPRYLRRLVGPAQRYLDRRRARRAPQPSSADLVILQLELSRLAQEVQRMHATDQPHPHFRILACTGAYDQVLLECCRHIQWEPPRERPPLTRDERLRAEMALIAAGVNW